MKNGLRVLLLSVALVALPSRSGAQRPDGRLNGIVVDKASGAPVSQAVVVNLASGRIATTDSVGGFRFDSLPMGIVRFLVRAKGFPSEGLIVALAKGEVMERRVELDSSAATVAAKASGASSSPGRVDPGAGQLLPKVAVSATPSLGTRFANFERRRATGAGHYITREEIEKSGFASLQDVVRGVRGVTVECGGGMGCRIRMVRAPMQCLPEYVVDDNVDNSFGPGIPIRDIEAIEIYTGPSDVPGEYAGRNAGCGVIVIWTRSGPPRRKKG